MLCKVDEKILKVNALLDWLENWKSVATKIWDPTALMWKFLGFLYHFLI